jgi:hypothetical protein
MYMRTRVVRANHLVRAEDLTSFEQKVNIRFPRQKSLFLTNSTTNRNLTIATLDLLHLALEKIVQSSCYSSRITPHSLCRMPSAKWPD